MKWLWLGVGAVLVLLTVLGAVTGGPPPQHVWAPCVGVDDASNQECDRYYQDQQEELEQDR